MNKLPHSVGSVVNYFVGKLQSNPSFTNMKLQYLLYFANGWWLAFHKYPLINEYFSAKEYGIECSSAWHEYKSFGGSNINKYMRELCADNSGSWELKTNKVMDEKTIKHLDNILKYYGQFDGTVLSAMARKDDADNPWALARNRAKPYGMRMEPIRIDEIKTYFKKLKATKSSY